MKKPICFVLCFIAPLAFFLNAQLEKSTANDNMNIITKEKVAITSPKDKIINKNIIDITNEIPKTNYIVGRNNYKADTIVLHITADSVDGKAIDWFKKVNSKASSHYVVNKDGKIYNCIDINNTAYHAGIVYNPTAEVYYDKGKINPNNYTIGIECVSNGEPLTNEQKNSLCYLLIKLHTELNIPLTDYHVIGHNELDVKDRKLDPVSSYKVNDILKLCKNNN